MQILSNCYSRTLDITSQGASHINTKLFFAAEELKKMNIEHRTSNRMLNKKTNIEQRMVIGGKPELLNDILEETEELIKIFVTSIKTAEKKKK